MLMHISRRQAAERPPGRPSWRNCNSGGWRAKDDITLLAIDDSAGRRQIWRRSALDRQRRRAFDFLFGLSFPAEAEVGRR